MGRRRREPHPDSPASVGRWPIAGQTLQGRVDPDARGGLLRARPNHEAARGKGGKSGSEVKKKSTFNGACTLVQICSMQILKLGDMTVNYARATFHLIFVKKMAEKGVVP